MTENDGPSKLQDMKLTDLCAGQDNNSVNKYYMYIMTKCNFFVSFNTQRYNCE